VESLLTWWALIPNSGILLAIALTSWGMGKRIYQLHATRKELNPPPPVNVRLRLHDGRQVHVDCVLSKTRTWNIVLPEHVRPSDVDGFHVDELPPYTAIGARPDRA
jgi:hypothetical protein